MPSTQSTTTSQTPPPAAKRRWPALLLALFGGMIGAGVGYSLASLLPGLMNVGVYSKAEKLSVIALCVPAFFLGILIHELGHVIGGKLAGFRFLLLLVGPLKLQRTPEGLRFGLNRSAALAGGLACLLPTNDHRLVPRMALMIAGGPAASLVLALAAGLTGWTWYGTFTPVAPPSFGALAGALGLVMTGTISLGLFAVSAFPANTSGFATDGRRLAMLSRKGPRAEREAALVMLTSAALSGVRAREYPPELVSRATEHDDRSSFGLMGKLLGYYHWLDRGEPRRAGELLGEVLADHASLPRMSQESIWAEHAYWLAMYGADPVGARASLQKAGRCELDPASRLRAEAAVLRAEGHQSAATTKADEALLALRSRSLSVKPSDDVMEWIEALRQPPAPNPQPVMPRAL